MKPRGRHAEPGREASAEQDARVVRDAEDVLVAALQESDTAVETFHDAELDARRGARARGRTLTLAGVLLAVIGIVVARRRS